MNKLGAEARLRIVLMLCEGRSIRTIASVTGVSKNTVGKLLSDAGAVCAAYQDKAFRRLRCQRIQIDEIWSFPFTNAKNVAAAKDAQDRAGDAWTWTAICADTKLVPSWLIGGRDCRYAMAFIDDLASRLANRVHLKSDGRCTYLEAVGGALGADVDYGLAVKLYGTSPEATEGHNGLAGCKDACESRVEENLNPRQVSALYTERQNPTFRCFTCLRNAFSKRVENHAYAIALHFMYHNFIRVDHTLQMTPAVAAGVTNRSWRVADIVELLETKEAEQKARAPHK